MMSRYSLSTIS